MLVTPKWLEGMVAPTLLLWLYALARGIASATGPPGAEMPPRAEIASTIAEGFIMAFWVLADARKRQRNLPYDYGSLVFFAWPIAVPIYLFQTRGARALITLLWFGCTRVAEFVAANAVPLIQRFAQSQQ